MEWGGWRRYREEKLVKGLLNFWWFVKICNRYIFHMKIIITSEEIWNFCKWDKRNYHGIVLLDFLEFLDYESLRSETKEVMLFRNYFFISCEVQNHIEKYWEYRSPFSKEFINYYRHMVANFSWNIAIYLLSGTKFHWRLDGWRWTNRFERFTS